MQSYVKISGKSNTDIVLMVLDKALSPLQTIGPNECCDSNRVNALLTRSTTV